jgi:nitrogen regulatory protein PII
MAKERIEKTLVIFNEEELRQTLQIAQRNKQKEIQYFMMKIFIKKVEAVLRRRCGEIR